MQPWAPVIAGAVLPAAFMWIAWRQRTLTIVAAASATLVAAAIAFLAGWQWAAAIDAYFLGLIAWVPFRSQAKSDPLDRPDGDAQLGAMDVLTPIAWSAATAIADAHLGHTDLSLVIFAGALATASADRWATEIGVLSSTAPRNLVRGSAVAPGTVGAISWLGLVAGSLAAWGTGLVIMATQILPPLFAKQAIPSQWGYFPLVCTFAGLAGMMADSVLGSIAQAMYHCPRCNRPTDQPQHHCGAITHKVRGWRGLANSGVDLLATMIGGAVALVLWLWLA